MLVTNFESAVLAKEPSYLARPAVLSMVLKRQSQESQLCYNFDFIQHLRLASLVCVPYK